MTSTWTVEGTMMVSDLLYLCWSRRDCVFLYSDLTVLLPSALEMGRHHLAPLGLGVHDAGPDMPTVKPAPQWDYLNDHGRCAEHP